jgi:formate hydrogenlyase transcriptional activator
MRILYLEDDPRDADLTVRLLGRTAPQFHFETVSNIQDALARLGRLESEPLDLVLTDMHLRDGDGLSLLRHIRENSLPVAVVVVTGMGDEETAVAALKARADDYVVKHKDYLDRLPIALESAVNHYRSVAARRAHPIKVLYAAELSTDIEDARRHLAVHADHVELNATCDAFAAIEALQSNVNRQYDVIVMDLHLGELNALDVLRELRIYQKQDVSVLLLCPPGDEEWARQGLMRGVSSYLVKNPGYLYQLPWELEEAHSRAELRRREAELQASEASLKTALAEIQELKDRLHEENIYLQEEIRVASNFGEIIGASDALTRVLRKAEQVAPINTTVLLLGETGTGKELLAHAIHNLSPRHDRALVKLNCAALPAQLIESELFGHEKGAFTGASSQRIGRFELADGGTIFLDEVGELPPELQAKLLRVLEEGQFEVLGSSKTVRVDVRVIAATNRNLEEAIHRGTFRSDLYYRLNIFPITLPPLRERMEDVPMLATNILRQLCAKLGKKIETIPKTTMTAFMEYSWPGNIRELRNVIERAAIISQDSKLHLIESLESLSIEVESPAQFPESTSDDAGKAFAPETLEESEYNLIVRTLNRVHWRLEGQGGAAELLKVNPSTLRSRMKKHGISRPRIQSAGN